MTIGLVKESMDLESRVALVPDDVALIIQKGVGVLVENHAGANSGYGNEAYESVGAKIVDSKTAWGQDLVVKCKEPLEHEYPLLKEKATLFSYLDLAYQKSLCEMFIDKKITSICTETIAGPKNDYPILAPMSVVAGRLAAHLVQHYLLALEHVKGFMGKGVMLGGLSGAQRAKIVVVGGGVVGMESAKVLSQMGAKVTILELDYAKLQNHPYYHLYDLEVLSVNEANIIQALSGAVGLVGAVLVTASQTPKVILRKHLKYMQEQGVVIDVACDLGGCIETIHQTSHSNPVYVEEDLLHYGVPNMPGIVAKTSSTAYSHASVPYLLYYLEHGLKGFLTANTKIVANTLGGLSAYNGYITQEGIAKAFNLAFKSPSDILKEL